MKAELNAQMTTLKAECADRVTELEEQLNSSHDDRATSMFQQEKEVTIYFSLTFYRYLNILNDSFIHYNRPVVNFNKHC